MPLNRFAVGSLLAILASCASQAPLPPPNQDAVAELLQAESLYQIDQIDPLFPEENLLALNAQMRFFVQENVPSVLSPRAKLNYLLDAMIRPSQLGLKYEPGTTLNAKDTFYLKEGNCLSLSSLFIAMAREAGLNAYYNEVTIPPSWDMISENSMAFYQHINAAVDFGNGDIQVVDLSVDNYDYNYHQTPISDQRAAAQHYNNRAIEHLNKDDTSGAYRYLHRALFLDPNAGHIWGNLGTVFRRDGHKHEAELAYKQALFLNNQDQVALNNLGRLYRETDQNKKAKRLEEQSLTFQRSNPFWHFGRARQEYEQGDFDASLRAVNRAISLDKEQYRFYQFQALVYKKLGNRNASIQSAKQASRLKLQQ